MLRSFRLFRALGIMRGIVCGVVVVTSGLAGGAEAMAGYLLSVQQSAVVEVGLPATTRLFTPDAVLSVCEVGRHADVEFVRHRLPYIALRQHRHLVIPPVDSGEQRS